jgi:hypothetical protein
VVSAAVDGLVTNASLIAGLGRSAHGDADRRGDANGRGVGKSFYWTMSRPRLCRRTSVVILTARSCSGESPLADVTVKISRP